MKFSEAALEYENFGVRQLRVLVDATIVLPEPIAHVWATVNRELAVEYNRRRRAKFSTLFAKKLFFYAGLPDFFVDFRYVDRS